MKRYGLALWAAPLLFLSIFFFYPLACILRLAFENLFASGIGFDLVARAVRPLWFTTWQAALSTVLTLAVGLPAAYVFGRYKFRGKALLMAMTTIPFILPTVITAAGFNALLGPRGWINLLLMAVFGLSAPPVNILNSLAAILLAHVFYNTAIVIRVVGSAWAQLDQRIVMAGRVLGASPLRTLLEVTLPLLRPSILAAALLTFLFDFTSFGVILMLGGPRFATLEVEIYIQTLQMLNLPLAGLLSAVQILSVLALTLAYSWLGKGGALQLMPRFKEEGMRRPRSWRERLLIGGVVAAMGALLLLPLAALGLRSVTRLEAERGQRQAVTASFTLAYYRELFINRQQSLFYTPPVDAVRNSLTYASAAVCLSLSLGFLMAYALNRRSRLNRWLEPLIMLPLGTSAVTLGLGFLLAFNKPPLDVRSFPYLTPVAHSLVALPVVVRILQPALASIPVSLRQAAAALGASPLRVWLEVDLPVVARAALAGGIFAFTISLGEFGATSFLSRPEFPTMPIAIFRYLSQPGALNYGQALAMSTLLMLVCGGSILALEKLSNG